jgi:hypothetical protein
MFLPFGMLLSLRLKASSGRRTLYKRQGSSLRLPSWPSRPGFWHQAPCGQRCVVEQRHQEATPPLAKDAHQSNAGRSPRPPLLGYQRRDVWDRAGRDGLLCCPTDAQQPQGGDGDGQPQAGRPFWPRHVRALPLPARAFGDFEPLLDPRPQPIPAGIAGSGGADRSGATTGPCTQPPSAPAACSAAGDGDL